MKKIDTFIYGLLFTSIGFLAIFLIFNGIDKSSFELLQAITNFFGIIAVLITIIQFSVRDSEREKEVDSLIKIAHINHERHKLDYQPNLCFINANVDYSAKIEGKNVLIYELGNNGNKAMSVTWDVKKNTTSSLFSFQFHTGYSVENFYTNTEIMEFLPGQKIVFRVDYSNKVDAELLLIFKFFDLPGNGYYQAVFVSEEDKFISYIIGKDEYEKSNKP